MIVKNESKVIKRCLSSVKHLINSWCIVDTGSTDETATIISEVLKEIPGEIHHRPWLNFGFNRSEAIFLSKRRNSDYLLLIDADNEVQDAGFSSESLTADLYYARHVGSLDYCRPILINSNLDWEWRGSTHEYIHANQSKKFDTIKSLKFISHDDGSSRTNKFQRDIKLLTEEIKSQPSNARSIFYLAQSHRDIGNLSQAIHYYKQRSMMKGWDEEVWYSKYQIARLSEIQGSPWQQSLTEYLDAYEFRPTRIEPLYRICNHYRKINKHNIAKLYGEPGLNKPYPDDLLFIEKWIYDYALCDEMSIVYYYTNEYSKSIALCERILNTVVDETIVNRVKNNLKMLQEKHG